MNIQKFIEDRELTPLEMRCGAAGAIIGFFIALWLGYEVGTIINNWLGFKNIFLRGFLDLLAITTLGHGTSGILGLIGCNIGLIFIKKTRKEV